MEAQYKAFMQEGWHIKAEAQERLFAEVQELNVPLRQLLLDTDLRKFGQQYLPDNINHADSLPLKGAHVLQMVSLEDVSKPSKGVGLSTHRFTVTMLTSACAPVQHLMLFLSIQ